MPIQSVNPATGEVAARYDEFTPEQTAAALDAVAAAWPAWRDTPVQERAACLRRAADVLRDRADGLARIMALEMGKPVRQGRGEVAKCALACDYYAESGPDMLAPEHVAGVGRRAMVRYEPLGTVLTVMPWNFPFWQVFRIAAPSLVAGNTVVLKHASNVPRCALAIEEVLTAAGLPGDVFRTLLIGARQVESVLDHASVFAVSLTGSEPAGRQVAAAAGARIKTSLLELGGSDPFVVLADADLDQAAETGARSRCNNTGQACIAAKRFIVHAGVYEPFLERLAKAMAAFKAGDPMSGDTDMGPMASAALRDELQAQVERCLAAGGRALMGGAVPAGPGCFYPPTILVDVPTDADVAREELFGPVALVFRVEDEDRAVALANDTPFGLGGSVWTVDEEHGLEVAARIKAGTVFVNGLVRSDLHMPFGGVGNSGYGRELGAWGIREFVNVKSVCVG